MFSLTFASVIGVLTVTVGLLVKLLGFPDQFFKNYRRKSTEGLSSIFYILAFVSYMLWAIHGLIQGDWVVIIGQGAGVVTTGAIVYQLMIYRKKK